MNSSKSPIIENNNNRSITYLLFFLLVLGLYYFSINQKNDEILVAQPVEEERPIERPDQKSENNINGERVATIAANKMNVFYIGVENPIEIKMPGVSSGDIKVSIAAGGANIKAVGGGQFVVSVSRPTDECKVTVSAGDFSYSESFRVKRIPQPVVRLRDKEDGSIAADAFKSQKGLVAWLDDFDFDAKCQVQGFNLTRISKNGATKMITNLGGQYTDETVKLINVANPDDIYQFTNVRVNCPGDPASRQANSLVFSIR
ncbi:MAG: GldM family protein [Saprospiraceae bacterium]